MNYSLILKYLIPTILTLSILTSRFIGLGATPPGVNIDEASYGYDAFSLLESGRDQWGITYPLSLKSYGDYKPAGLAYAMLPFINIFGLNTFSTRLPAALAGVIIVFLLYKLLRVLGHGHLFSMIMSTIFSFSPWAYGIGRQFYEPSLALMLFAIGLILILKSFQRPLTRLQSILLGLVLGFSGYFYVAYRLTAALTLIVYLTLLFFIKNKPSLKSGLIGFVIFFVVSLPLIPSTLFGSSRTRLKQESLLRTFDHALTIQDNRQMCYLASSKNPYITKLCYLTWNKPVIKLERMVKTLITTMSPDYLFLNPHQKDIIPKGYGAYLLILTPLYYLGLYSLLSKLKSPRSRTVAIFITTTYLLVQMPGILIESPLIHRNLAGLFMAFIIICDGTATLLRLIARKLSRRAALTLYIVFTLAVAFSTLQYLSYYYSVFTKTQAEVWNYDTYPLMQYVKQQTAKYHQVVFSRLEDPILNYAFVNQIDPNSFRRLSDMNPQNSSGWQHYRSYDSLTTSPLSLEQYLCDNPARPLNTLFVTTPQPTYRQYAAWISYDFTKVHPLHEVYNLDYLVEKMGPHLELNCNN